LFKPHTALLPLLIALALTGCGNDERQGIADIKTRIAKSDVTGTTAALRSLIKKFPESGEARFMLGEHLLHLGEVKEALAELERARKLKFNGTGWLPTYARALLLNGKVSEIIDLAVKEPSGSGASQDDFLVVLAQAYRSQGNRELALQTVDKVLTVTPEHVAAKLVRIRLALDERQLQLAERELESLTRDHAGNAEVWYVRSELLSTQPDGDGASLDALRKALSLDGLHLQARMALISQLIGHGKLPEATQEMNLLRKHAPTLFGTGLLDGHLALAKGELTRARSIFQSLLKNAPDSPTLLQGAAETELRLDGLEQAETLANRLLKLQPDNPVAPRLLARVYMRKGQGDRASQVMAARVGARDASATDLALAAQAAELAGDRSASQALYKRLALTKPTEPVLRTLVATTVTGSAEALGQQLNAISQDDAGVTADLGLLALHLRENRLDAALETVATLERKMPGRALPFQFKAQVLQQKGDRAGARAALEAGLARQAGHPGSVMALAQMDLLDGQVERARQRYADLIKTRPHDSSLLLALADLNLRSGAPDDLVRKPLEAAVKLNPQDPTIRRTIVTRYLDHGDRAAALNAANAAAAALPNDVSIQDMLGQVQLAASEFDQAISTFGRLATEQPNSVIGPLGMARSHLLKNEPTQALRNAQRALEREPQNLDALAVLAGAHTGLKQYDAAIKAARQAREAHPLEARPILVEAEVHIAQQQWEPAIALLEQALEKTGPGTAHHRLHGLLLKTGKTAAADKLADQWLRAHPQDARFIAYLAQQSDAMGRVDVAERLYRQLLTLAPTHAAAMNNLAMLLLRQNKPGAQELVERALQLSPRDPNYLDTLAASHATRKAWAQAIEVQAKALSLAPRSVPMQLSLARYQIEAGDKLEARTQLRKLAGAELPMSDAQQQELKILQARLLQ
jgi:putative PEP-CTERM system TPR-repeat lipoprotein